MKLGVVIVSFNVKDLMAQTLSTLKTSLDHANANNGNFQYEVITVDNNSTDGVTKMIKDGFKWVKLIENSANLGFSRANNIGVKTLGKDVDYVLFLNNDVKVEKDTILDCLNYISQKTGIGILTCKVDLYTGGIDWDCHRAFPSVWNSFCYFTGLEKVFGRLLPVVFGQYHMMDKDLSLTHEVDLCLGAFMLVPKKVGDKINWWPDDYFLNGEDVDFCYQVKKVLGYKVVYYPQVKIIHYKGASKGTKLQSAHITKASDKIKNIQIRAGVSAMEIFYDKYYATKNGFIINWLVKTGIKTLYLIRKLRKKE